MKKLYTLCALVTTMLSQSAWAAPIGWYDYNATWNDGTFSGKFYYDSAAPERITAVQGTLVSTVQTTSVNQNFYMDDFQLASWNFLANTNPAVPGEHDAGFYVTLVDLGASLTLDLAGINSMWDWSREREEIYDSQLQSFSITQTVPEPGSSVLLLGGLAGLTALRRTKSQRN